MILLPLFLLIRCPLILRISPNHLRVLDSLAKYLNLILGFGGHNFLYSIIIQLLSHLGYGLSRRPILQVF